MSHKILQISDYITLMGGIEMYIDTTSRLLTVHGMHICNIWVSISSFWLHKLKYLLLPFGAFNIFSTMYMVIVYYSFKPDTIRFHSVSRFHGRLPLIVSKQCNVRRLMMYHDLWYFHPFPSKVTQEDQVLPWWYTNWIKMTTDTLKRNNIGWWKYIISLIWSLLKYLHMSLLRYALLTAIDVHMIPSSFMESYLLDWWVKKSSIKILPHYIVDKNTL